MHSNSAQALSNTSEALPALSALFHSVLEGVATPIVVISGSGKIEAANTGFADTFSTTVDALIGADRREVLSFHAVKLFSSDSGTGHLEPRYQLRVSVNNSDMAFLGINIQRVWFADRRLAIFSCQDLSRLFAKRREIKSLQENLELKVRMRTLALANRVRELDEARDRLSTTLKTLQATQASLLNAEKMAALGGLVAGVAHEVNTPLGISVTASSHLEEELKSLSRSYAEGSITNDQMTQFLGSSDEAVRIINNNLARAASLIRSFKKVAVDQNDEQARIINIKDYIDDVLLSLQPKIKPTNHKVCVSCEPGLVLNTYPGILAQVVTNLISNSLLHAFTEVEYGEMCIEITAEDSGDIFFKYHDTGSGIPAELQDTVFEPFVTSKRGQGGTGLGLHILHNLVTQKLGGTVTCTSAIDQGACFEMRWPQTVEAAYSKEAL